MRRLALVVAGAGLALLGACSNPPTMGTVYNKQYHPSYTYYTQVCVAYGKYGCKVYMPFPHTMPEEWDLCLKADRGDGSHDKQGCFPTDRRTWLTYNVGDHFPDAR